MFIRGIRAGYFHLTVREYERDGQMLLYGVRRSKLTVARFGQPAEIWGEEATLETAAGEVLTVRVGMGLGKNQMLAREGTVRGRVLDMTVNGATQKTVPFPTGVLGVAGEAGLFAAKRPKTGRRVRV